MRSFANALKVFLGFCSVLLAVSTAVAQAPGKSPDPINSQPVRTPTAKGSESTNKGNTNAAGAVDPRVENSSEEAAAILPYYNNYLREYHLGPEDVISVEVFGQPAYSKSGIVIPPTARISYPLIPGGVFVGGKTVDEVSEDIKKKLNEYIIEPQVTVTLDKVGSARYSVLGRVGNPGVKVMNRRYNLYEAIAEAGGIDRDGDKGRIVLIRLDPSGGVSQTVFDMKKLMKGESDVPYLVPGDQVIVPEKRWNLTKIVSTVGQASVLRILFGVGL